MKILKKLSAATAVLAAVLVMSVNASAEEVAGFDYAPAGNNFKYYDFTAEDGAKGTLTYTVGSDGKLYFSSYKIDAPAPESPEDFPNFADPEKDYRQFYSSTEFFNYLSELSEKDGKNLNYVGIVSKFDVSFDPPSNHVIQMYGEKFYIADPENMTVHYAGFYCESMDIAEEYPAEEEEMPYCTGMTEDGANYKISLEKRENGELVLGGLMIDNIPPKYDIVENGGSKIISWRGDVMVYKNFDTSGFGDELVSIKFDIPIGEETITVYKHYIVTVDGEKSTMHYYCMSLGMDDKTASPKTGNRGGYLSIMLAAAALAVLAKCSKK